MLVKLIEMISISGDKMLHALMVYMTVLMLL